MMPLLTAEYAYLFLIVSIRFSLLLEIASSHWPPTISPLCPYLRRTSVLAPPSVLLAHHPSLHVIIATADSSNDNDDASNDTSARAPSDKSHGGSTYKPDKNAKTTDASTDRPDKRAKTSDASTDRIDRDKASKTSVSLDELSLDMQKALQQLVNSKEGPAVKENHERLKLVGLDPMDHIFLATFHLFGMSINMREACMTLPPIPEVLKGWIKIDTILGIFK
ncbi:unnamed protein product [Lactuca saligna]|uniref:Uncharacterized protein n=1 Tax=Lactuca saligna TaxID=75948 RepID=A0AA35YPD3_LACSI|nr:unnamed protein product [Lactuca saligna]